MPGLRVDVDLAKDPGQEPLELDGDRFLVGRARDCLVRILTGPVSRHHALLVLVNGRWMVQDLDSSNGTFVNGRRIATAELRNGDVLRLGEQGVTFTITALDPPPPADDEGLDGTRIIRLKDKRQGR